MGMSEKSEEKHLTDKKIFKDIDIVAQFIKIYCDNNHHEVKKTLVKAKGQVGAYINDLEMNLCESCRKLLLYSSSMRINCPFNPKPACKKCETHCYKGHYRDEIRKVMKFSGIYSIKKGKLGLIKKYFFLKSR